MKMLKQTTIASLVLAAITAICVWVAWNKRDEIRFWLNPPERELTLSGNVDDRQVDLAFLISERVEEILVEEGTAVRKGDLLGTLETVRIENFVAEAEAGRAAAQAALDKAIVGARPEEIAMAEAGVRIVESQIQAAENGFRRNQDLAKQNAASRQEADDSEANYHKLLAERDLARENLKRLTAGTRSEDVAAARANLAQAEAVLAAKRQNLDDTKLFAPCDGIVRNRILEPGETASPQTTAIRLAIVSPKWVRCYLSEPLLPKVRVGDDAIVSVDGLDATFDGRVGFISPAAEFTPKNVETEELRSSLVYEVRVFVDDPENRLKLGEPATVSFPEIKVAR